MANRRAPLEGQQTFEEVHVIQTGANLRTQCVGCRLHFRGLSQRRQLSDRHRQELARTLGATSESIAASKSLWPTDDPHYREFTYAKSQLAGYWQAMTLPYPEDGIRLLSDAQVATFCARADEMIAHFDAAVRNLDSFLPELVDKSRERLGRAFDANDYPTTVIGVLQAEYSFPSLTLPEHLQVSPELRQRLEAQLISRFEEAAGLAEEALAESLSEAVNGLVSSLNNVTAGQARCFRDSTVTNIFAALDDFKQRFGPLGIGRGGQLERLIEQTRLIVQTHRQGASDAELRESLPQALRNNVPLRQEIASQLAQVGRLLEGQLETRSRRRRAITLPPVATATAVT